jgi:hypothetical protein
MAKARMTESWNHTADMMALLANINRPKGKKPYGRSHFHPLMEYQRHGLKLTRSSLASIRGAFAR